MQQLHDLYNFIITQPDSTWTTLGAYLGGSTLVATVLQLVKHKLNIADAKKLVTFLLGLFSFVAAFANYLLQTTAQNPTVLGKNTALIIAGAVFIHRFAVSPIYTKIVVGLNKLIADASAYRASTQPVAPLPLSEASTEATTPETFSV